MQVHRGSGVWKSKCWWLGEESVCEAAGQPVCCACLW